MEIYIYKLLSITNKTANDLFSINGIVRQIFQSAGHFFAVILNE